MTLIIRKPNLEDLTEEGIPRDFAEVRDYFNDSLANNTQPWIPRQTPITNDEIMKMWVPSAETNINYVAEVDGKIVGSVTIFYNPSSSKYEHAGKRPIGSMAGTVATRVDELLIRKKLNEKVIDELIAMNKKATFPTAVESPATKAMAELGYKPVRTEFAEEYKRKGISGQVNIYELP